jgi:mRNA-degrading endonuclease RelE of RelBE toxin-antitoxin system
MYRVEYASGRIGKVLEKLDAKRRQQIIADIDSKLKNYSWRTPGVKHLKGMGDLHRLRCGDYRVVFVAQAHIIRVVGIYDPY